MGRRGIIKTVGLNDKRKFNRINYLQKKYEGLNSKGKYNKNQYKRFVNVVSSNYMMTRWQRKQAKYIIDNNDLKSLYSFSKSIGGDYRAIVTAICFYVMRKDNRIMPYRGGFVQSTGLNKRIYDVVSKKLKEQEESSDEANTYYIVDKG